MNRDDIVILLEKTFGGKVTSTKEVWEFVKDIKEVKNKEAIEIFREIGKEVGRGKYIIGAPVDSIEPLHAKRKLTEPESNPVVVEYKPTPSREFTRITSSDLSYNPIQVPEKEDGYTPFGAHDTVLKVLRSGEFAPIYIVGDSGYGKTLTVEQTCERTNRPLALVNITNETSEDDLIGGLRIVDGDTVFEYGPVIRAYREGAVLLLDEIDQGTSQILCLQTIMQRKPYFIKKTGEVVRPHPNFMVIATGNTKGLGDDIEGQFAGAQILNEAFLERFPITLTQEAPSEAVEKKILGHHCGDSEFVGALVRWANLTRQARAKGTIPREIQTRRLVHIARNLKALGDKKEAIMMALGRFDQTTQDALIMLFNKIDGSVVL